ncbi:hypothetical protein ACIQCF_07455 [Streptomyces sp. NPDC088353]|uniref:hypothetical protein n=1 Tax=Streptomyces sp. NPDC088353 TaxID=3365855 RepID=UPI003824E1D1
MTQQLTDQQLDEIEARAGHLYEYEQQPEEADVLAGTDVPALAAEVRRLRARVSEMENDVALLHALEAAGVDNWEGYDDALARL